MNHLHLMKLFIEITNEGSFTGGARRLGITASKATKDIHKLEESLQSKLLNRTTRKLGLTDAGLTYYRKATEILELYDSMQDEVLGLKGHLSGKLRITATETWGQVNLQPLIIEFVKAHPNVQIEAFFTDRVIDIYRENIHIAFRYMLPSNEPYLSRYIVPQYLYICASADYIAQHGLPETLDDLQAQNFVCYLPIEKTRTHFDVTLEGVTKSIYLKGSLSFDCMKSVYQAVKQGFGVGFISDYLIPEEEFTSGRLIRILPSAILAKKSYYALYSQKKSESRLVTEFVNFAVKKFAKKNQALS